MSRRFFSDQPITSDSVQLSGPEAHHLIHVMRAKVDDQVDLFDGSGAEFSARIDQVRRRDVVLHVQSKRWVDRELPFELVLAVALPRGDRQEWLVQKAVELGVTQLVPWQTQRSVARANDKSLERLRRTVIEASKQCGRNRLMEIRATCDFAEFLPQAAARPSLLAHVDAAGTVSAWRDELSGRIVESGVQLGIGPEGGFGDDEVQQAVAAGWRMVGLGPRILRTETAALAFAAHVSLAMQRSDA